MHDLSDVTRLPDDFDGRVRLFPLPGLVLFPHAMQPLHIFEPRYCEMLRESLAGDQLIAMATLHDGVPSKVGSDPAIDRIVCIGKVISLARARELLEASKAKKRAGGPGGGPGPRNYKRKSASRE